MRLITYNIHKGIGSRDRRYRLQRIVEVIERENPDLMCLQEVDRHVQRSRFDDQPQELAERFCCAAKVFQLNVRLKHGGYGNLILSRWPIVEKHQISLQVRNKKPRGAQLAVIDTPEGPLHLINCHLGLAEKERHLQIRRLLTHYLFRRSAQLPTVIAGDTNDWRNTLQQGPFATHGFQQMTAPISRFRSFPAYMPVGALDKVFCRGQIAVRHTRAVRTRLAKKASDHLPIVVDMHLA
ncbi:MAG: endonuclease [Planctomycetales bacterium]|nr:endonuclease [Planctomycetales bacterium]